MRLDKDMIIFKNATGIGYRIDFIFYFKESKSFQALLRSPRIFQPQRKDNKILIPRFDLADPIHGTRIENSRFQM